MKKKILIMACASLAIAAFVAIQAAPVDQGVLDTGAGGNGKGVPNYQLSRWSVVKVGAEANSGSLSTTNVVQASPGIVGKIVFVPGAISDTLKVYNATAGSGTSASALTFEGQPNSPTMANSPTVGFTAGAPIIYDLLPGWNHTSGIVTIITRTGNTATGSKAYIGYDIPR